MLKQYVWMQDVYIREQINRRLNLLRYSVFMFAWKYQVQDSFAKRISSMSTLWINVVKKGLQITFLSPVRLNQVFKSTSVSSLSPVFYPVQCCNDFAQNSEIASLINP
jgi:hypothetical protein